MHRIMLRALYILDLRAPPRAVYLAVVVDVSVALEGLAPSTTTLNTQCHVGKHGHTLGPRHGCVGSLMAHSWLTLQCKRVRGCIQSVLKAHAQIS